MHVANLGLPAAPERRKGNWKPEGQNPGSPAQPTKQVLKTSRGKGSKTQGQGYRDLHVISARAAGREALQGPGSARRPLPRPELRLPGAGPGGGIPAVQRRKPWKPCLSCASRTRGSPSAAEPKAVHRLQITGPVTCRRVHCYRAMQPGTKSRRFLTAPGPAPSGGEGAVPRALSRSASSNPPGDPRPPPPNPPALTETCCCASAAARKRAPRPSEFRPDTSPPPRAGGPRGIRGRGAAPCQPGLHRPPLRRLSSRQAAGFRPSVHLAARRTGRESGRLRLGPRPP